jgi:hypothetical protein
MSRTTHSSIVLGGDASSYGRPPSGRPPSHGRRAGAPPAYPSGLQYHDTRREGHGVSSSANAGEYGHGSGGYTSSAHSGRGQGQVGASATPAASTRPPISSRSDASTRTRRDEVWEMKRQRFMARRAASGGASSRAGTPLAANGVKDYGRTPVVGSPAAASLTARSSASASGGTRGMERRDSLDDLKAGWTPSSAGGHADALQAGSRGSSGQGHRRQSAGIAMNAADRYSPIDASYRTPSRGDSGYGGGGSYGSGPSASYGAPPTHGGGGSYGSGPSASYGAPPTHGGGGS